MRSLLRQVMCWAWAFSGLGVWCVGAPAAGEAPPTDGVLEWRVKENSVDARIEGWSLSRLLEAISAKTRWQVYVEPRTRHTVVAKFHGLSAGEALRRLLGNLSYLLVPSTNGPAKLLIFQTSMDAATDLVAAPRERAGDGKAHPLLGERVIRLKPGAKETIDELAQRLGAKVIGRADDLRAYRLKWDSEAAAQEAMAALAQDTNVAGVAYNYPVAPPDLPESLLGAGSVGFNPFPKATASGKQVVVGLVDTGVQTQGTPLKDYLLPALSVAGQASLPTDQPTHGTGMAETILAGIAQTPSAADGTPVRILPVDVYGGSETTSTFDVAKGIADAISGGASIINLSLGGPDDSPLLHEVITSGYNQGVVFLAAAGNAPVSTPTYPAAYPEVVGVTATQGGQIASYANFGNFITAAAPGTSLIPYQDQTYVVVGTSTATAYVSAAAAVLMSTGHATGPALTAQLRQLFGVPRPGGAP